MKKLILLLGLIIPLMAFSQIKNYTIKAVTELSTDGTFLYNGNAIDFTGGLLSRTNGGTGINGTGFTFYHSGNANLGTVPWNASTISTNGVTRIDASGNYTGGSGNFRKDAIGTSTILLLKNQADVNAVGQGVAIELGAGLSGNDGWQIKSEATSTFGNLPNLIFSNQDNGGGFNERFRITPSRIAVTGNAVVSGTIQASAGDITNILKETGTFTSGFGGNNWQINPNDEGLGISHLTIDRLTVRDRMDVYELVVNKIRATNGSIWVTDAVKVATVSGTTLTVNADTDITFVANDIIKAQEFDGRNVRTYTARVVSTAASSFVVTDVVGTGWDGMELVRMGNSTDVSRQGSIYLTGSDNNSPYIDILDDVNTASLAGKTRVRIGDLSGVSGQTGYGVWGSRNGTEESFVISSDGYARIAGWSFDNTSLYNYFNGGEIRLSTGNNKPRMQIYKNNGDYVRMYHSSTDVNDWGIDGFYGGNHIFQFGSTNQIAGWSFDNSYLWSGTKQTADTYSTTGITLSSAGAIRTPEFYVSNVDGSAHFKGVLEAPSGTIGGFIIQTNSLSASSSGNSCSIAAGQVTSISATVSTQGVIQGIQKSQQFNTCGVKGIYSSTDVAPTVSCGVYARSAYAGSWGLYVDAISPSLGAAKFNGYVNISGNIDINGTINGMKVIHGSFYSNTDGDQTLVLTELSNVRVVNANMAGSNALGPIHTKTPISGNTVTFNRDDAYSNGTIYYVAYGW